MTKKIFKYLDFPNLLTMIWYYGQFPKDDEIIKNYVKWNIELAAEKWKIDEYKNFAETIYSIYKNDQKKLIWGSFCPIKETLLNIYNISLFII